MCCLIRTLIIGLMLKINFNLTKKNTSWHYKNWIFCCIIYYKLLLIKNIIIVWFQGNVGAVFFYPKIFIIINKTSLYFHNQSKSKTYSYMLVVTGNTWNLKNHNTYYILICISNLLRLFKKWYIPIGYNSYLYMSLFFCF